MDVVHAGADVVGAQHGEVEAGESVGGAVEGGSDDEVAVVGAVVPLRGRLHFVVAGDFEFDLIPLDAGYLGDGLAAGDVFDPPSACARLHVAEEDDAVSGRSGDDASLAGTEGGGEE